MQPEEFSEGEYIDINEQSGYDKKEVPAGVVLASHFTLYGLSEIFTIESAKDEMLETGPDLERSNLPRHRKYAQSMF